MHLNIPTCSFRVKFPLGHRASRCTIPVPRKPMSTRAVPQLSNEFHSKCLILVSVIKQMCQCCLKAIHQVSRSTTLLCSYSSRTVADSVNTGISLWNAKR
ncbi:hypothetical protein KIL84_015251 [Mauremys mutica]|uniref:Uncharacterized protein n=1 Tax=Mauremys mutica TaxID=74926 RepID=A0A9D4APT9_9SAUR|nr:hypothetical protein KIL84_015251 [Mauremys mutica]